MTKPQYLIWSNYSLDYEDWREDLEAEYPELSEQEREEKMYERNSEYLDDEKADSGDCRSRPLEWTLQRLQGNQERQHQGLPVLGVRLCNLVC